MSRTGSITLVVGIVLGLIYIVLTSAAANGYGYMGYAGYHRGPSFWYWGAPSTFYDRNVRSGSLSGAGIRGGGPGSGK